MCLWYTRQNNDVKKSFQKWFTQNSEATYMITSVSRYNFNISTQFTAIVGNTRFISEELFCPSFINAFHRLCSLTCWFPWSSSYLSYHKYVDVRFAGRSVFGGDELSVRFPVRLDLRFKDHNFWLSSSNQNNLILSPTTLLL